MLDTHALSEPIRKPQGSLARRLGGLGPDAVCTSIVAASELRFGAMRKGSAPLARRVEQLLQVITVLPLDTRADEHCADIRAALERSGTPIGGHGLLRRSGSAGLLRPPAGGGPGHRPGSGGALHRRARTLARHDPAHAQPARVRACARLDRRGLAAGQRLIGLIAEGTRPARAA
jgi:tRNA(fMet)-specific endonuclease VapC